MPQDFAETWLPRVLSTFARAHPAVRIEVRTERNAHLVNHVMTGKLDLALAQELTAPRRARSRGEG
ncbi:LysR substrate-binding domain-containing protein [Corallococcus aberystwythensis]|uniref:LysR substrate-binding domain-containing protein n=1 Tax=Corallococcus aberystwythensis TaxID=2316722 RepID=UPI001ABFDC6B|nr:LysR substrate-binding domain-containing protein [Corallococcus aberystwythensis]